jgi:quinohemoprotein ethanol dehydrogenase
MDIELATVTIAGKRREVLFQAPKNGFFYVIDRATGKLISAQKLDQVTWARRIDLKTGRPVENPNIRYEHGPTLLWPGYYGVHNWPPMSFSPRDGLVFIPSIHMAGNYNTEGVDEKTWTPAPTVWTTGMGDVDRNLPLEEFGSSLLAWDPISQKEVWRVPTAGTWGGGTMATAGELVLQGQLDGTFNAFDARSGRKSWSFNAGVAVTGAPISYSVDGKQYITVLAGPPGGTAAYPAANVSFGWHYRDPRRILTFALDGKAELPPSPPPGPATALKDGMPADPALARTGAGLFGANCTQCHGVGAVAGGGGPDLRASAIPLSPEAFARIVHDGPLVARGMPAFGEFSAAQMEALRNYIRARAEGLSSESSSAGGP